MVATRRQLAEAGDSFVSPSGRSADRHFGYSAGTIRDRPRLLATTSIGGSAEFWIDVSRVERRRLRHVPVGVDDFNPASDIFLQVFATSSSSASLAGEVHPSCSRSSAG